MIRGSSEQEAQLRAALAKSVAEASHPDRREDIAKAFESVVGAKGEGKKAVDDFLTSRAGNLPSSVDLGTGSVKVLNKDERVVLNVGFHLSAGVKFKEVREFVEKLFEDDIDLEQHHLDRGWGMIRVPQSQVTKLVGVESSRKLVSDSGKIEVEIRTKSVKNKDYFLTEGHWADLKGGQQKRKRPAFTEGEKKKKMDLKELPFYPKQYGNWQKDNQWSGQSWQAPYQWYGQPQNSYGPGKGKGQARVFPFKGGKGGKGGKAGY